MSDFLKNLRSSHKKDVPGLRRSLDGHYYPQTERRRTPDRRASYNGELETLWAGLNDTLPQLIETVAELTRTFEKKFQEDTGHVQAEIRRDNAISQFFDNLNRFFSEDMAAIDPSCRPKATASYASGTHYTKDDILSIIRNMRKDGATFAIIADFLKDKGIPTFSGRGEWHAQTIHRLCK